MPSLTTVQAILSLVDSVLGGNIGKGLLSLLHQDSRFTPEQLANLDANYEDYIRMKTQLEQEIEEDKKSVTRKPN